MPVTAQVRSVVGHDDEVESALGNHLFASRADVLLPGGIGLNRADRHPEKIAHKTSAIAAPTASTTMTMSKTVLRCSRNGLKPMPRTVTRFGHHYGSCP